MRTKLTAAGCFLALALGAGATSTHYVSTNGQHKSPFTNMDDAATNLASAVAVAPSGGTVIIDRGHYHENANVWIGNKALVITSLWGAAETIIDGGGAARNLRWYISNATGVNRVYGLTITNFYNSAFRISDNLNAALALYDSVITGNSSDLGGAIHNQHGYLWVYRCVFRGNTATHGTWGGGAIYNGHAANEMIVSDSFFIGNTGGTRGGAICIRSSGWTISNSTVSNNTASSEGGGIYAEDMNGEIINSFIVDNTSGGNGGGVRGGTIFNSLIARNTANMETGRGGGARNSRLINCTVIDNSAFWVGGSDTSHALNSIIYFNNITREEFYSFTSNRCVSGVSYTNVITAPYVEPNQWYSGDISWVDCIEEDPMLDADFKPRKGSSAINAGLYQEWMDDAVDLAGRPRILQGAVDIGAYEYVPAATLIMVR